jgi:hypothetical protein
MAMEQGSSVSVVTETASESQESLAERLRQLTDEVQDLLRGIDRLIGHELEPADSQNPSGR